MTDERGVILFDCVWERTPPIADTPARVRLIEWRNRLAERDLIGVDSSGIGYGNVSVRVRPGDDVFVITGSQTGHVKQANITHFCLVTEFDAHQNRVCCRGPVKASSESLTHGMVYRASRSVGAVIHVHHEGIWAAATRSMRQTPAGVEAGTVEMASAISELIAGDSLEAVGVINMRGHRGGLLAIGPDLDSAGGLLLELHDAYLEGRH